MVKHLAHTLQDSFEYEGLWWFPDNPDDTVPGKLSFDPTKGARLSLNGALTPLPSVINAGDKAFHCGVINGISANGVKCTLIDNYEVGSNISFPGFRTQKFLSNLLFLGEIVPNIQSLLFSSCRVTYDHLEEWVFSNPFQMEFINEESKMVGYSVTAVTRVLFDEYIEAADIRLSLDNRLNMPRRDSKQLTIGNEAYIRIISNNPGDFDEFRKLIMEIGRLIALMIGDNTWPCKLHLTVVEEVKAEEKAPPITVSAFYRLPLNRVTRTLHRHYMPVEFSTFVEHLPDIVNRWLGCGQGIKSAISLFFAALYNEQMHLENKFLNLVHALESYHRIALGGKYQNEDDYEPVRKKLKEAIPENLSEGHKAALKSRLQYGNEFSLRKRLTELLNSLDNMLLELVRGVPTREGVDAFVGKVVDTRNYHVHYDESLAKQAMTVDEMFSANTRLALLVRILLLRELGFGDGEIYTMLHDKRALLPWD